MATFIKKVMMSLLMVASAALAVNAQSSLPAPGSGGSYNPAPSSPAGGGPANPGPGLGPGWGGPCGAGWNCGPAMGYYPIYSSPSWQNSGSANVVACGYDAQGVWRTLPLYVTYSYNGVVYDVEVVNAWNPWTGMWNYNVDVQAINTSYYLRGTWYNFYVVLSTGTYYFNL